VRRLVCILILLIPFLLAAETDPTGAPSTGAVGTDAASVVGPINVNGTEQEDPNLYDATHITWERCTASGVPHADCNAAGDIIALVSPDIDFDPRTIDFSLFEDIDLGPTTNGNRFFVRRTSTTDVEGQTDGYIGLYVDQWAQGYLYTEHNFVIDSVDGYITIQDHTDIGRYHGIDELTFKIFGDVNAGDAGEHYAQLQIPNATGWLELTRHQFNGVIDDSDIFGLSIEMPVSITHELTVEGAATFDEGLTVPWDKVITSRLYLPSIPPEEIQATLILGDDQITSGVRFITKNGEVTFDGYIRMKERASDPGEINADYGSLWLEDDGGGVAELRYTNITTTYNVATEAYVQGRPQQCLHNITTEQIGDILMCGVAPVVLALVSLDCVATGGSTLDEFTIEIVACDENATNCVRSGFSINADTVDLNYQDTDGTYYGVTTGDWWGLELVSGTNADFMNCQVEYRKF